MYDKGTVSADAFYVEYVSDYNIWRKRKLEQREAMSMVRRSPHADKLTTYMTGGCLPISGQGKIDRLMNKGAVRLDAKQWVYNHDGTYWLCEEQD
jgi:hypothetical protein